MRWKMNQRDRLGQYNQNHYSFEPFSQFTQKNKDSAKNAQKLEPISNNILIYATSHKK